MQFALLFAYDPAGPGPSDEELPAWLALDERLRETGAFVHDAAFQGHDQTQVVRVRDGSATVSGTPEGGGRDLLAGFYVVEAPDIDAAVALATQVPTATYGSVEVRPLIDFEAEGTG